MKDVLIKTIYKLRKRKTGILGNRRSTQEGGEGNFQDDGKGKSLNNSCAVRIENNQPKGEQNKRILGGMSPERDRDRNSQLSDGFEDMKHSIESHGT